MRKLFSGKTDLKLLMKQSGVIASRERQKTLSFADSLDAIMKEKKVSRSALAVEIGLSEKTISRIKNNDDYCTVKQIVIGICVALRLTPAEAFALFSKSSHRLRMTCAQDVAYFHILSTCGAYSLSQVNDLLEERGFELIGGLCKKYQEG